MANAGYIRVSSADQNEGRQLDGVALDERFVDKLSGKDMERPQLQEVIRWARKGDVVHVHSMDRLARNLQDLRTIVDQINGKGASVRFHKEGLEFTGEANPMQELLLNMLGAVAQFERALIRERQQEGIALAKKRGAYKGRKKALSASQAKDLMQRVEAGESKAALAREFGVTRATLYKYLSA